MRWIQPVRCGQQVLRSRARERHWRTCSSGLQASGSRPAHEQLAQPPRVGAIGLGAALAAAQRAGLHRLGQMRDRAGTLDSARQTNNQPVHASTATWISRPGNRSDPLAQRLAGVDSI